MQRKHKQGARAWECHSHLGWTFDSAMQGGDVQAGTHAALDALKKHGLDGPSITFTCNCALVSFPSRCGVKDGGWDMWEEVHLTWHFTNETSCSDRRLKKLCSGSQAQGRSWAQADVVTFWLLTRTAMWHLQESCYPGRRVEDRVDKRGINQKLVCRVKEQQSQKCTEKHKATLCENCIHAISVEVSRVEESPTE